MRDGSFRQLVSYAVMLVEIQYFFEQSAGLERKRLA